MKNHIKSFLLILLFIISQDYIYGADPVVIGNARFTFITDNLVRLEYALNQEFVDDSTLFAVNRKTICKELTVKKIDERHYEMCTSYFKLVYFADGFPFGQKNLQVYFKNGEVENEWKIISRQTKNLLGPITTLDEVYKEVPRQNGLLSRDGWMRIDDTGKEIIHNGWFASRNRNHVQDIYLFIYGDDYKSALKSLKQVSGAIPMPRKYIHGAWYCRWWNYSDDDYRQIAREYKEHNFPLDIMVFDMGWHRQNVNIGTGHADQRGWTGYSWNRDLIKNPAKLIEDFKKDNIYVVLNEHPHDGIRPYEDCYNSFMHDLGKNPKKDPVPVFDAGDKTYMSAFLKNAHKESDSMGVAFWWLDWQQDYIYPFVRGTNMNHLAWLNELYFNYSKQNNLRGTGFSRWSGWGDHRHPIQFSGDAVANWDLLKFEIDLTTTSGNAGCCFWAHDIGGFSGGHDPELYTRWTQFGLLNSSLRIHSMWGEDMDRRPWLWGDKAEKAMRKIYHMRSQIMPYVYSSVYQCHNDMLPLNRGLYIEYPREEKAYKYPGEFLFGDLILGAPVTQAGVGDNNIATQQVWLPGNPASDTWHHLFNGKRYTAGTTITIESPIDEFPVFVKGGYPLPMQPYTDRMCSTPLTTLIVRCFPGNVGCDNTFTLYEDDGITTDYERGHCTKTILGYKMISDKNVIVTIGAANGSYDGQPDKRSYRIELPGITANAKITAADKKLKAIYSQEIKGIIVEIPEKSIHKSFVINVAM